MKIQQLVFLCLVLCVSVSVSALDYDKYKKRKANQQKSVLSAAKKAAKDWDFDKAEKLLKQAQNMAYTPDKVEAVDALIGSERSAKAEKERKEREAREEKKRQEHLAKRNRDLNSVNRIERNRVKSIGSREYDSGGNYYTYFVRCYPYGYGTILGSPDSQDRNNPETIKYCASNIYGKGSKCWGWVSIDPSWSVQNAAQFICK